MAGPFIFVATNRLKPDTLHAERRRVPGLVDFIKTNEPRLIAFNEYVNADGTEVGVVQVHPDTDSFEFHLSMVRPCRIVARRQRGMSARRSPAVVNRHQFPAVHFTIS